MKNQLVLSISASAIPPLIQGRWPKAGEVIPYLNSNSKPNPSSNKSNPSKSTLPPLTAIGETLDLLLPMNLAKPEENISTGLVGFTRIILQQNVTDNLIIALKQKVREFH